MPDQIKVTVVVKTLRDSSTECMIIMPESKEHRCFTDGVRYLQTLSAVQELLTRDFTDPTASIALSMRPKPILTMKTQMHSVDFLERLTKLLAKKFAVPGIEPLIQTIHVSSQEVSLHSAYDQHVKSTRDFVARCRRDSHRISVLDTDHGRDVHLNITEKIFSTEDFDQFQMLCKIITTAIKEFLLLYGVGGTDYMQQPSSKDPLKACWRNLRSKYGAELQKLDDFELLLRDRVFDILLEHKAPTSPISDRATLSKQHKSRLIPY